MKILIVIPVYNEKKSLVRVIKELIHQLKIKVHNFKFNILIINDGSSDGTGAILKYLKTDNIIIINKKNEGHGKTCLYGYKFAVQNNYDYVMQIDSDGQCHPKYISTFLKFIPNENLIFGNRKKRLDGFSRIIVSKLLALFIFFFKYCWLPDANCPYRLIRVKLLKNIIFKIPPNLALVNIYLTYKLHKSYKIKYIPIIFRKRFYGKSKYDASKMLLLFFNFIKYS